jgi:hypothetical protein
MRKGALYEVQCCANASCGSTNTHTLIIGMCVIPVLHFRLCFRLDLRFTMNVSTMASFVAGEVMPPATPFAWEHEAFTQALVVDLQQEAAVPTRTFIKPIFKSVYCFRMVL